MNTLDYSMLGVTDDATLEDVKTAYRALVHKHTLDPAGNRVDFTYINDAYQRICDYHHKQKQHALDRNSHMPIEYSTMMNDTVRDDFADTITTQCGVCMQETHFTYNGEYYICDSCSRKYGEITQEYNKESPREKADQQAHKGGLPWWAWWIIFFCIVKALRLLFFNS